LVVDEGEIVEQEILASITYFGNEVKVTAPRVLNRPEVAAFGLPAEANLMPIWS